MIGGTGVDIISVKRISRAHKRFGAKILDRIFSQQERDYCFARKDPYPCLAARFALKEATIKALSSFSFRGINMKDITLDGSHFGKKSLKINGKLKEKIEKTEIRRFHVSISHERDYAVAQVIIEI